MSSQTCFVGEAGATDATLDGTLAVAFSLSSWLLTAHFFFFFFSFFATKFRPEDGHHDNAGSVIGEQRASAHTQRHNRHNGGTVCV